jgi:serine/threonine protein kinase
MIGETQTVAFEGTFELGAASTTTDLKAGMVWGNFWLIKPLKNGGISEKFSAKRMSDSRNVVLKILPPMYSEDPVSTERYVRYMGEFSMCGHPNLPALIEMGCHRNLFYLAFEDRPGECLDTIIEREGPFDEMEALIAIQRIADALCILENDYGLAHECIKPGNVQADDMGNIVLLDAGSDKRILKLRGCETVEACETPAQADVLGLGMVLSFILTGKYPIDENGDFMSVEELDPDVSAETGQLLANLLTTTPDITPLGVVQHVEDYMAAREQSVIEERDRIRTQRQRDARKIWLIIGGGALGIVSLIIGLVFLLPASKPKPTRPSPAARSSESETKAAVPLSTLSLRGKLSTVIRSYERHSSQYRDMRRCCSSYGGKPPL